MTNDTTMPSSSPPTSLDVLANCSDIDAKFVIGDIKAVIALMSFILTASGIKIFDFLFCIYCTIACDVVVSVCNLYTSMYGSQNAGIQSTCTFSEFFLFF